MYSKMFKPLTISLVLTAIVVMFMLTTADGWQARSICRGVVDEDTNPESPCIASSEAECLAKPSFTVEIDDSTRDCYYGYPGYKCQTKQTKLYYGEAECVWDGSACSEGSPSTEGDFNDCEETTSNRDA